MSIVLLVYVAGLVESLSCLLFCGGVVGILTYCIRNSDRGWMNGCKNPRKVITNQQKLLVKFVTPSSK